MSDEASAVGAAPAASRPESPVDRWTLAERRRRRRLQIRSVRRIVRRVELWSVLKLSMILYLCLWAVLLVAALILWNAVDSTGLIDRIEAFVTQIFGLDSFAFDPGQIFRVYALGSLVMAFLATVFNVMAAVLFNLISELVGGLRIMLVEEESTRFRPARARPRRVRPRGPARRPPW
ncbi:MAG: DUF3566 domain-containing protein [Acidimicrobiia bacterium]|nr:DUF3566 domain-containing protein [Acidimicrobiia bacterium]